MARGRRALWKNHVARWVESGLGGAEFAARAGLKESTLRHWKWQLGYEQRLRAARTKELRPEFVEVTSAVSVQLVGVAAFELVLGGSRLLRIPPTFDEGALRRLLAVLEGG